MKRAWNPDAAARAKEGGETGCRTSRYLRLAVETSSLVSLEEKRPSLLTIPSQRRSRSTPLRIPSCPPKQSKTEHVRRDRRNRGTAIGEGGRAEGDLPGRGRSWRRASGDGTPCRRGRGAGDRRSPPPRRGGAAAPPSCRRPPPPPSSAAGYLAAARERSPGKTLDKWW
jgi:hypothetical protein